MIIPSIRSESIIYAVRDVTLIAENAAKRGKKLYYLNIGDPNQYDFDTPEHLKSAVIEALKVNHHNGYSHSSGIQVAREAIRREAEERKKIRNIQEIFITTGASEAIEICIAALCNAGDNVLCPTPGYPLYSAVLGKYNIEYRPYYLVEEEEWAPSAEEISKLIDKNTKAIVLINPNNPTGALYSIPTLEKLVEMALRNNIVVLSDEIYDKLLMDNLKHTSIAGLSSELPCVTFGGISKNYLAPGWRIGWGVVSGPHEKTKLYVEAINKFLRARLCANHPMQFAIPAALDGDHSFLKDVIQRLQKRRDLSIQKLSAIPGISVVKPTGAFYSFPKLQIEGEDEDWVKGLIQSTGVVVVHGSGFGEREGTKHFRFVFLPDEETLNLAFELIEQYQRLWLSGKRDFSNE
ncbi:MAG: aminotransferase class I/II-fold pyridoxal phosphate-dependent enzyme [bacterium]|nr:aminotransferase class I/II-fold pyridoxal phosphate-dependent enzyme [bacterium]